MTVALDLYTFFHTILFDLTVFCTTACACQQENYKMSALYRCVYLCCGFSWHELRAISLATLVKAPQILDYEQSIYILDLLKKRFNSTSTNNVRLKQAPSSGPLPLPPRTCFKLVYNSFGSVSQVQMLVCSSESVRQKECAVDGSVALSQETVKVEGTPLPLHLTSSTPTH